MEAQAPSPQTTLLILLGASEWPLFPEFQSAKAFANAVRRLKAYFLNPQPFGLPAENVLDLFDSDKSADELDVEISQFLERRLIDMKKAGHPARDVLLYFVGHGGFVGHDADFYLAIRRTRIDNPRASGLQVMALADTLTARARFLRRIVILDCCFAAAAFSAFEAGPDQVAIEKTVDAFKVGYRAVGFPTKGTTLLCSSSHKSPSLLLPDGSSTMFTKAFLDTLVQGASLPRDYLTLRDMKDLAADLLAEIRNAPRPVVLSPDQSEGDIADVPFFPNPRAQEERARQAEEQARKEEEERQQRAEEERRRRDEEAIQARKAEQERLRRKIEEERRRQAEEEHTRKEEERRRQAEEAERTRRMEEERRQRVEQEQQPSQEPSSAQPIKGFQPRDPLTDSRQQQEPEEYACKEEEEQRRRAGEERVHQGEAQVRKAEPPGSALGALQSPEMPIIQTSVPPARSTQSGQSLPPTILAPVPSPAPSPTRTPRKVSRRTVLVGLAVGWALVTGGGITWWFLTPHPFYTYRGHSDSVFSVAWSPDGKRIASASYDKTVQVWDASNGGNVYTYRGHSNPVHSVAWSPDGKRIASASEDKTVQVWDASNGGNVYTYHGHSNSPYGVPSVVWSPDGKRIASASYDKTVQVWDASNGGNVYTYRGHSDSVVAVAWSPDGKRIASGSGDHTVQVWDAANGGSVYTYRGHSEGVWAVAWSPDGKRIASGGYDKTVQVWDASNGGDIYTYRGHSNSPPGSAPSVAWSPDGKRIASGSGDHTVQVWDAANGGNVYIYGGHSSYVYSVAWSPDGKRIASGGYDKTVQVWDAK